jgi:glycosyltransferase involved in cell wall biosynthesis
MINETVGSFTIHEGGLKAELGLNQKQASAIQLMVNGCLAQPLSKVVEQIDEQSSTVYLNYPFSESDFVEIYLPSIKAYVKPSTQTGFIKPQVSSLKVGIGLVTYNRLDYVKGFIERFSTLPNHNCTEFVVADDGSADETVKWCKSNGIKVITGCNKGVAWNKNRALYYLLHKEIDVILLLEDDCWPSDPFWIAAWAEVAYKFNHVNFGHPVILKTNKNAIEGGAGTVELPFFSSLVTGQCTAITRAALSKVGFLDSRFKGFGGAHVEWSFRFNKVFPVTLNGESRQDLFATFRGGLIENDASSYRDEDQVKRNRVLRKKMANDQVYKKPWRNLLQKIEFLWEVFKSKPGLH